MKNRHIARVVCAAIIGVALLWSAFPRTVPYAYEDVRYRLDPTPARAFAYGERHFNATDPAHYDLVRAENFFEKAAIDLSLPYVNHELARISFLKGDFAKALAQIDLQISLHGTTTPNSYYVRGLIEGFMGRYADAVKDYKTYIEADPTNWAATNDLAWVLLKDKRPAEALVAIDKVLPLWPHSAWLLNSRATALFELGRLKEANAAARAATEAIKNVTEADWLQAYPGNDPLIAQQGIAAFKKAVEENMHTISLALEKSTKGR
ncbi:tetratricopeptide repeat protein [Candidatus Kaiserbacteria bacterium]|nr:tetratricopeptide repeat protein [Candidatus Kaiserbacteria bacterium]